MSFVGGKPWRSSSEMVAFAEGEQGPDDLQIMKSVVSSLALRSAWVIGAPAIVDILDPSAPTVGVLLRLPVADPSDVATETRALSDVEAFIDALEEATAAYRRDLAVQLDGEIIGWVQSGSRNDGLAKGLIAPWWEHLEGMGGQPRPSN